MIIRNTHADYSANNIGILDIPVELNTIAAAIVAQFTNQSLSNVKKSALNTLTSTLQAAGIWSKINMLLMPCLASSVTEAYLDVINQDATMLNSGSDNYDTTTLRLDANGLGIYQNAAFSANGLAPAKSGKTFSGTITMFANEQTKVAGAHSIGELTNSIIVWRNKSAAHASRTGNVNSGIGITNHTWTVDNNYSEVVTYTIGSALTASNFFDYINGVKQEVSILSSQTISQGYTEGKIMPFVPSTSASTYPNKNPISIWGTASGLSDSESKTLCDAIQAFQSAFFAE